MLHTVAKSSIAAGRLFQTLTIRLQKKCFLMSTHVYSLHEGAYFTLIRVLYEHGLLNSEFHSYEPGDFKGNFSGVQGTEPQ